MDHGKTMADYLTSFHAQPIIRDSTMFYHTPAYNVLWCAGTVDFYSGFTGGAEIDGPDNDGPSKLRGMTLADLT